MHVASEYGFFGSLIQYQTLAWAIEKPGLKTLYQLSGLTVLIAETAGSPAVGNADQPLDWVPDPNWAPNTDTSSESCINARGDTQFQPPKQTLFINFLN